MDIYFLAFTLALFLFDVFIIVISSFLVYDSVILLKIRSVHKQDTMDFLERIKKDYNYAFVFIPHFVLFYVANTVILLVFVILIRGFLFYAVNLHFHPAYSAYLLAYLLIPLSFFLATRIKIDQLEAVENTIHVAGRDYPVGDMIMGMITLFYFKEEPKVYGFLKKIMMLSAKGGFVFWHLVFPLMSIPLAILVFIKTHSWVISLAIIIAGLLGLAFFYLFNRKLKVTWFTIALLLLLLLAGVIGAAISEPGIMLLILAAIAYFLIMYVIRKIKRLMQKKT